MDFWKFGEREREMGREREREEEEEEEKTISRRRKNKTKQKTHVSGQSRKCQSSERQHGGKKCFSFETSGIFSRLI